MTEEQKQLLAVGKALEGKLTQCPICHGKEFQALGVISANAVVNGMTSLGSSWHLLQMQCLNCHHVMLFKADELGIK